MEIELSRLKNEQAKLGEQVKSVGLVLETSEIVAVRISASPYRSADAS